MRRVTLLTGIFAVLSSVSLARTAHAQFSFAGTPAGEDYYVGCIPATAQVAICNTTTNVQTPVTPPGGACTLTQDVHMTLDGGNDRAHVVTAAGKNTNGCGNYNPIVYGGFEVRIAGQQGNDELVGGFGRTHLFGGPGNDSLTIRNAAGQADGLPNDDNVCSNFAGGGESLFGNDGNDCIEQLTQGTAAALFDGSVGTSDVYRVPVPAPLSVVGMEGTIVVPCGCTSSL